MEALVVKIVSKDYRTAATVDSNGTRSGVRAVSLMSSVKVSYKQGPLSTVMTGNEARIPLQHHELLVVSWC